MINKYHKIYKGRKQSAQKGFTKEGLKKKFRPSEFFSEKIITFIALLSITIIILIFLFVFRESLPIFKKKPALTENSVPSHRHSEKTTEELIKPETYGGVDQGDMELKPETYGVEKESETQEMKPERYGVDDSNDSEVIGEKYDYSADEHSQESSSSAISTFTSRDWMPVSDKPRYGFLPLIVGTLKVTLIAILLAAPIAILAAVYTSSFASPGLREIIKPAVELLAAFPSVVIGFFALMVMASFFQNVFGYASRLNAFVGGAAMALAAIPVIYTITEDALSSVPRTYKEASFALGANKWQTVFFVILPAATPGIFAALLLGIGRVFGETMIALMATGNAALISANPFESVRTLSATIGAEMAEVVFGDTHYSVLFLIGSLLFIFTFMINSIAEFYVKGKLIKRIQGN